MVFVKGNTLGKGRPKGSPNKTTLLKEERRAIFDQRVSERFIETIDGARPEYLLDQFLGKAPDTLKHEGTLTIVDMASEIIEKNALPSSTEHDS